MQSSELSNLYKMVAKAMESSIKSERSVEGQAVSSSSTHTTAESSSTNAATKREECPAITLRCTPFSHHHETKRKQPRHTPDGASGTHHPHPLYITVALMEGNRGDQRCFHCILTDCPRTRAVGKLGSVTPELFALMFAPGAANSEGGDEAEPCSDGAESQV